MYTFSPQGQFQDGRAHGQGLVTFADGSHGQPKQEGRFEGDRCGRCCVHVATSTERAAVPVCRCVQRGQATEATRRARQLASQARALQQQLS